MQPLYQILLIAGLINVGKFGAGTHQLSSRINVASHCGGASAGTLSCTAQMCSEITRDERGCVETAINLGAFFVAVFRFSSAANLFFCKLKYLLLMPRAAQNAVAVWPDTACWSINFCHCCGVRLAIRFPLVKDLGYGGWALGARWGLLVAYSLFLRQRLSLFIARAKSPLFRLSQTRWASFSLIKYWRDTSEDWIIKVRFIRDVKGGKDLPLRCRRQQRIHASDATAPP